MGDISSFGTLSHALTRDSSRGEVLRLLYTDYQKDDIYSFSISKTDFSLIQRTPNSIVVFVIAKPRIIEDPLSFEEDRAQLSCLDQQIECSAIHYLFNTSPKDARYRQGYSEVADKIKGYDFSYIWCNSKHLSKFLQECGKEYPENYSVNFSISKELKFSANGNPIVSELHDLWFLVNNHNPILDNEIYAWWVTDLKNNS